MSGLPHELISPELARYIDAELERRETEAAIEGFEAGVRAVLGAPLARAVTVSLLGETAPGEEAKDGVSRSLASKWVCRVRRNLGFPIESPHKARTGRKGVKS